MTAMIADPAGAEPRPGPAPAGVQERSPAVFPPGPYGLACPAGTGRSPDLSWAPPGASTGSASWFRCVVVAVSPLRRSSGCWTFVIMRSLLVAP
ncbi:MULTISPECIES: hypothetical protein [Catenuloplanes]|uniref:Uncharacterized protein n=1 Tax=Catenuloplanes niger TaxID=587534 RepID=A0AAE4CXX0_9ACTN|nr:hypothetical protein [Catenuloplanes niger]MDR7325244.1 hypothetical protein [Catenuloplanes niger]